MVYGVLDGCLWYMAQYGRMIVAHILLIVAVSFSGMMRTSFFWRGLTLCHIVPSLIPCLSC